MDFCMNCCFNVSELCFLAPLQTLEIINDRDADDCLYWIICPEERQESLSKRALYYTVVGAFCINTHTCTHSHTHTYSTPERESMRQGPMRQFISGFCFTATASWERGVCQ